MSNEPNFDNNLLNMPADDIIDISLAATARKKFRIDGDNSRIIELNTSDMGIVQRMTEIYPKLKDLQARASKTMDGIEVSDDDDIEDSMRTAVTMSERLNSIDTEMRILVDELFNADVSSKTAPDGSMYDPFNGMFRFEHIISTLAELYQSNFKKEFQTLSAQVSKHTDKYVGN